MAGIFEAEEFQTKESICEKYMSVNVHEHEKKDFYLLSFYKVIVLLTEMFFILS